MEKENFKIEKKKQTGEFEFIIEKRLLVLSITDGWSKELNLVGWNGNRAKFDIKGRTKGNFRKCRYGIKTN